ncbi:MAG TPA: zf-HC2 domain-containing protein [Paraburkholderia sp.]|jgi:anti-sigma factor RsiW|nr:zf-HC2 domain-containing protein [Paraburkholderia sp.]
MKLDDILLMAYVDGELSPQERRQVEEQIAASPDAEERIAHLTASRLPYREAFGSQKLPPVPDSLTRKIEELARAHKAAAANPAAPVAAAAAAPSAERSANDARIEHNAQMPPSAPVRSHLRVAPAWLAVAFVAGAFCLGAVLRLAPGVVPAMPGGEFSTASNGASPWIRAVVDYQKLYARETVAFGAVDATDSAQTVAQIRDDDKLSLRVPDLSAAGLQFKRVTRLRFQGKPLVQIEYLPPHGPPVALCVMKDVRPDEAVAQAKVSDMDVVTWRQDELHYALVGGNKDVDLMSLGKQISGRGIDQLFGKNGVVALHRTVS